MTDPGLQHSQGVDRAFVTEFMRRWETAWNSHDPGQLLELLTEDIVYDDSAWPRTMNGHGEVREFLQFVWRAVPDLRFQMVDGPFLLESAPKAAFYWTGTGTFTGPLDPPGFAPTGAPLKFDGFDEHEYRDGRVCRLRIVFDMMDVTRQIGMVPKAGSGVEKAAATAQRLIMRAKEGVQARRASGAQS